MRFFFLFVILFFGIGYSLSCKGKSSEFIYERDLSKHLFYYDLLDRTMLPYVNLEVPENVLYGLLKSDFEKKGFLIFQTENKASLFLDGYLLGEFLADTKVIVDLDALHLEEGIDHLFSFYSREGVSFLDGVWVVTKLKNQFQKGDSADNVGIYRFREKKVTHLYVFLVLSLVVLAYMRFIQSPYISAYFDVTKFASRLGIEDFIFINPFTWHSVVIMFLVSGFYAVGLANIDFYFGLFNSYNIVNIFFLSALIVIVLLFKYVFLLVLSSLFGDSKVSKIHFFEFIRFFSLFGFFFLAYSIHANTLLGNILLGVYLIWLVWVLFELVRKSRYRKMYLISYLCISEVFPIFILLKQMGRW